jgi:hypothetical protein
MSEHDHSMPLPPATFEFLVASLVMQAQMNLGMLHFGRAEDKPEMNLPLARHSIDLLAMLQDKTRGNLSVEEQRELENSLTELRFRYVHAMEQAAKAKQTEVPGADAERAPASDDASAAQSS